MMWLHRLLWFASRSALDGSGGGGPPYTPSLDFSVVANSQFLPLVS